jgi:hypothetical protein
MATSSTIRIDQDVRAELQRWARPLEDTPNSVLRRLLGLPQRDARAMNPRVAKLLELVQDLVGKTVQLQPQEWGYAVVSRSEKLVAYIKPQKERLKIVARKGEAEKAGLTDWEQQRQDRFFAGVGVKWHIEDGDDAAYRRAAAVLAKLRNCE